MTESVATALLGVGPLLTDDVVRVGVAHAPLDEALGRTNVVVGFRSEAQVGGGVHLLLLFLRPGAHDAAG